MKFKILSILVASLAVSTSASAVELIANGDFSAGFSGFTSEYTAVTYGQPNSLFPEGTYTVGSNPNASHDSFVVKPEGNPMLLANGAESPQPGSEKALLLYNGFAPGTGQYVFSADVMNICCKFEFPGAQSSILFQISQAGVNSGIFQTIASFTTSPPGDAGLVNHVVQPSFSLLAGDFIFRIIDAIGAPSGNDFAVDNLSIQAAAVPGPIVGAGFPGLLMALGGLVALARRRRNQAV
jgi:hypothetical protein